MRAAVAGASGYVGASCCAAGGPPHARRRHRDGGRRAGTTVGDHHPHLVPLADRELGAPDPRRSMGHDVVFLALPHGHSAELAADLPDDTLVVDCGADFRLRDAQAWQEFYGGGHAGTWPVRPARAARSARPLRVARRVAVPGCYPTVSSLSVLPAAAAGSCAPTTWSSSPSPAPRGPAGRRSHTCWGPRPWDPRRRTASVGCTGTPGDRAEPRRGHRRPRSGCRSPRCWRRWPGASWPRSRHR
jgi:N-acetyl-gamma-glutamylphosphate reductase